MRLTSLFKFNHPFESWLPTIDPGSGNDTLTYTKGADLTGAIVQGAGSINLVTEDALPLHSQVRNLRDSKGQPVFVVNGLPYVMYVLTSDPQFDPFMRVIAWRHRLGRALPTTLQDTFDFFTDNVELGP